MKVNVKVNVNRKVNDKSTARINFKITARVNVKIKATVNCKIEAKKNRKVKVKVNGKINAEEKDNMTATAVSGYRIFSMALGVGPRATNRGSSMSSA